MKDFPGLLHFQLICFDFDGLLVNTEPHHHASYLEAFRKIGAPLEIDFHEYSRLAHSPLGTAPLYDALLEAYPSVTLTWDEVRKIKREIYTKRIDDQSVDLMPGVPEILLFAKENQIETCVVTNSLRNDTDSIRKHQPVLDQIPVWITREFHKRGKPFPDGYLAAAEHFPTIDETRVLGLDDSLVGITAIQAANFFPVLICDPSYPQVKRAVDVTFFPSLYFFTAPARKE